MSLHRGKKHARKCITVRRSCCIKHYNQCGCFTGIIAAFGILFLLALIYAVIVTVKWRKKTYVLL